MLLLIVSSFVVGAVEENKGKHPIERGFFDED